jgi:hypothetical protein
MGLFWRCYQQTAFETEWSACDHKTSSKVKLGVMGEALKLYFLKRAENKLAVIFI